MKVTRRQTRDIRIQIKVSKERINVESESGEVFSDSSNDELLNSMMHTLAVLFSANKTWPVGSETFQLLTWRVFEDLFTVYSSSDSEVC